MSSSQPRYNPLLNGGLMILRNNVSRAVAALFILGSSLQLCWSDSPSDFLSQNESSTHIQTQSNASYQANSLQCTRAKQGDTQPWIHNSEVLSSFPKDNPMPRFVGAFRDKARLYQLELYSDATGVFGELSSPLLEADSPTSRLYDVYFDPGKATLRFRARFRYGELEFSGVLRSTVINGTFDGGTYTQAVVLRRVQHFDKYPWVSRAQFNCAMLLFNRY